MRRSLDKDESVNLLKDNYIGQLAYISKARPYIVPISYYYDADTQTITGYTAEGHKLKSMRKNPSVALSVSAINSVGDWQSVLVHGTFEELKGIDAKHMLHKFSDGIKKILNSAKDKRVSYIREFSAKGESETIPVVFRIKIEDLTGKLRENHISST